MSSLKKNKKGLEMTIGAIIVMVLAILLLLTMIFGINIIPGLFKSVQTCNERGGICREGMYGSGCGTNEYNPGVKEGCKPGETCCVPLDKKEAKEGISKEEQTALETAVLVTINKDTTPILSGVPIALKAGYNYTFNFKFNDKLLKIKDKDSKPKYTESYCAVYLTDSKETGSKYLLPKEGSNGNLVEAKADEINAELEIEQCSKISKRVYSPSPTDVFKNLNMYVIVLDNESTYALGKFVSSIVTPTSPILTNQKEFMDMYSNPSHWMHMRNNKLSVSSLVTISGLSDEWVAKDEITITCTDVNCKNVGLALVQMSENPENPKEFDYEALYRSCTQKTHFVYQLETITSVTSQTTGIPLLPALNIGGFRIPTQKEKILYLTQRNMIEMIKNKATVTIDKATMINSFYVSDKNPDLFLGDKTYLCAKAKLSDGKEIFTLSDKPLKIDVLPPMVDSEKGIQVIYPDVQYNSPTGSASKNTPYYYRQYPRVSIKCDDLGQSGCASYDYYIKTGNFIDLNVETDDLVTALGATALTAGLNALMTSFAEKDALNTICPFILSDEYRPNSFPEIRFSGEGQAIMCVRVSDKAGNQVIVYKSLWTPNQMFKKIMTDIVANVTK
jgi:hypothetical protein